jgi:hypothetical protein
MGEHLLATLHNMEPLVALTLHLLLRPCSTAHHRLVILKPNNTLELLRMGRLTNSIVLGLTSVEDAKKHLIIREKVVGNSIRGTIGVVKSLHSSSG